MIRLPRWFILTVATFFVLNPLLTGVIELVGEGADLTSVLALALYAVVAPAYVLVHRELKMPLPIALVGLAAGIVIPLLVNFNLVGSDFGTPATWYVSGTSTLMAIAAVRQHKIIAWIGTSVLAMQVLVWGGTSAIFVSGLGGALALVAAAHVISVGLESSAKQTASYLASAKLTEAASAAESAVRKERSDRITSTLSEALPLLEKIATGKMSPADRHEAIILEEALRDEIRGRTLINPTLKASVRAARSRGIEVVLLDEGGFEEISELEREGLRNRLADELDLIRSGRVTIRSPLQEKTRVTFVASRSGTAKPDVFLRL